jgi:hypothetical protein
MGGAIIFVFIFFSLSNLISSTSGTGTAGSGTGEAGTVAGGGVSQIFSKRSFNVGLRVGTVDDADRNIGLGLRLLSEAETLWVNKLLIERNILVGLGFIIILL